MLTEAQIAEIEQRAQAFVDGTILDTEEQLEFAVAKQLARITQSPVAKRRATILAWAESAINPAVSHEEIFKRPDTVNKTNFFNTKKDWYYGADFREVLEIVTRLYIKFDSQKETRELLSRQRDWREKMREMGEDLLRKAREMLNRELDAIVVKDDGTGEEITIVPARWSFNTIPNFVTTADKVMRLALDMETDRTGLDMSWRGNLPPGVTEADAERAQRKYAELLAAEALARRNTGQTAAPRPVLDVETVEDDDGDAT